MYLPILHLPRVQLRYKLQEKLHRVTRPQDYMFNTVDRNPHHFVRITYQVFGDFLPQMRSCTVLKNFL